MGKTSITEKQWIWINGSWLLATCVEHVPALAGGPDIGGVVLLEME
jgi:hypothetical protein